MRAEVFLLALSLSVLYPLDDSTVTHGDVFPERTMIITAIRALPLLRLA